MLIIIINMTAVFPNMQVCILLLHAWACVHVQCTYFYVLPYMHVCTMLLLSRLLYSPTCMCVQCTYFYHDCCTPLHACVYNVHISITTAVLPYMHVYILLSRLLYSPTCMCTYFYHDCCTPLHACVHTSITTPYMHVCTMYILLSRLLYFPTGTCTGSWLLVVGFAMIVVSLVLWVAVGFQVGLQDSELFLLPSCIIIMHFKGHIHHNR